MANPVVLMILDGWGIEQPSATNAATEAYTPTLDRILKEGATAKLVCSGEAVGLPRGQQGNSEVGHLNLGGGRIVYQDLLRIQNDLANGTFQRNEAFTSAMDQAKKAQTALHLMGLLSDGGVHSHQEHLFALLAMAKEKGLEEVYLHLWLDGRDVPPASAMEYVKQLEAYIEKIGVGRIATVSGRYYAMDRDKRWERVEEAARAMLFGEGATYPSATSCLEASYQAEVTDEFVRPACIVPEGKMPIVMHDGDVAICFNYRADRAREITQALADPNFAAIDLHDRPHLRMVTMTEYEADMADYVTIAYPPVAVENNLGEWLSKKGKKQVRIAETEKYAHVTFFFNGGVETPYPNEARILIPSPKVATYDLEPEMSAEAVADAVCKRLYDKTDDFILVNFANPDMVGHTGVLDAAKKAVEAVDGGIAKILEALDAVDGILLLTADHGNCERMVDRDGSPYTAHTTNPVYVALYGKENVKLHDGVLADVAPTVLALMGLPQPEEMTGQSLIESI